MASKTINVPLLKEICEIEGAPGFEQPIRELVIREVSPLVDRVEVDNMGNVIAIKKGRSGDKKIMLTAHMDEIGFIVKHIDDKGFIKFHTLGGFDPKTLTAQRVKIHGSKDIIGVMGSKPIHLMTPEERNKNPRIDDYFIDTGMSKEELEKHISIGDPITRDRELIEMGNCVNCKSLDNRVSVFIQIEMLREMEEIPPYDVYAVFTVQEEIGIRGASTASLAIQPDFGFCIDTTIAFDVPGSNASNQVTALGEGVGIKIMDSSVVCDYRMVAYMKQVANTQKIKWQPEILTAGGTDSAGMQRMTAGGAIVGAVSIPTRHIHQVIEMAHKEDIRGTIELLKACVGGVDSYDWTHKRRYS